MNGIDKPHERGKGTHSPASRAGFGAAASNDHRGRAALLCAGMMPTHPRASSRWAVRAMFSCLALLLLFMLAPHAEARKPVVIGPKGRALPLPGKAQGPTPNPEQTGPRITVYFDTLYTEPVTCASTPLGILIAYVVAEGFTEPITAAAYMVDLHSNLTYLSHAIPSGFISIGDGPSGISIAFGDTLNAYEPLLLEVLYLQNLAACSDCNVLSQHITVVDNPFEGAIVGLAADLSTYIYASGGTAYTCGGGAGPADLEVVEFWGPSSAHLLEDITDRIHIRVRNSGTLAASTALAIYLSPNDTITTYDTHIVSFPLNLDANRDTVLSFSHPITMPGDADTGSMYLGLILDPDNLVPESDETNNIASSPMTVLGMEDWTCVYAEDFQEGPGGWTPKDLTEQTGIYWNLTTYDDGTGPRGVWWCGTSDPSYATPPGYGNGWDQLLSKDFTLPSGSVGIDYVIQYDTEPDYDYVYLQISTDGGTSFTTIDTLTGNSGGAFITRSIDLTPYAGSNATLRFYFHSDMSWSDEDGIYPTDGACRLDQVQVMGFPADDFETGSDGWIASAFPPVGGALRLEFQPSCSLGVGCQGTQWAYCNSWVAYDPATGNFPFASAEDRALERGVYLGIESPVIDIPPDADQASLEFDVYSFLPLDNGVFYSWEVSSPAGAPYQSAGYIYYYPTDTTLHRQLNITPYITPGATTLMIRLVALEWACGNPFSCAQHTAAPFFDNVKVSVLGSADPGIDCTGFPRPCSAVDNDKDGVGDLADACPGDNASFFDRNGDGCTDVNASAKHVEYWDQADTFTYYTQQDGAPGITDGSDFTAMQAGVSVWSSVPGASMPLVYKGTSTQTTAGLDGVNLVTFRDTEYRFSSAVLAVGIATSFTEPTYFNGKLYRPGQIADADIIFNSNKPFRTQTSGGSGTDIQSLTTHEAGHLYGLSHTAVQSATMFYVLQAATEASTLEPDDINSFFKAYGDSAALEASTRLSGTVTNGYNGEAIPGALVFAIDAATDDTAACEVTLPDGSYDFFGLPAGNYYVAVHPIDGTSAIGFLQPGYVNALVETTATTLFPPEYWNATEDNDEDPTLKDPILVSVLPVTGIDIITNVDTQGPQVVQVIPDSNSTDVDVEAALWVRFSEPIDENSVQGNFSLTKEPAGTFMSGNAALVRDDSVLTFVPLQPFDYSSTYILELKPGIKDKYGNPLASTFTTSFTTQAQPSLTATGIIPDRGAPGSVVVIKGAGFDPDPAGDIVTFSGSTGPLTAPVLEASASWLVTEVPPGAASGNVTVSVTPDVSNPVYFTLVSPIGAPRGFQSGSASLGALPRALAVDDGHRYAYAATDAGAAAIDIDPARADYLAVTSVPLAGGLVDIALAPGGNYAYGASQADSALYVISTDPMGAAYPTVAARLPIGAEPTGVAVDPTGSRAYVPTSAGEIQVWDIKEGSYSLWMQLGSIPSPEPSLKGKAAVNPAGQYLLALTGSGYLMVFALGPDTLKAKIAVGGDPRDVVVDPAGERAYVSNGSGLVSVVSLDGMFKVEDMSTGGSLRGIAIDPAAQFLYAANRQVNLIDVIDLNIASPTYRDIATTISPGVNPSDVTLSADGAYAYVLVEQSRQLVAVSLAGGPLLRTVHPQAAPPGGKLVLAGEEFGDNPDSTSVLFKSTSGLIAVQPERLSDAALTVAVPPGAVSGAVQVADSGMISNSVYLDVIDPSAPAGTPRLASRMGLGSVQLDGPMAATPQGDLALLATGDGRVIIVDIDPTSSTYSQVLASLQPSPSPAADIAASPDGKRSLVCVPSDRSVYILNSNRLDPGFGNVIGTVGFGSFPSDQPAAAVMSGSGALALIADAGTGLISLASVPPDPFDPIAVTDTTRAAGVSALAFHPADVWAYLATQDGRVAVLDTDPSSPSYGTVVGEVWLPNAPSESPVSLSFTPDGRRCLVLSEQGTGAVERRLVILDSSTPSTPLVAGTKSIGTGPSGGYERIAVSPRGDNALLVATGLGLYQASISTAVDTVYGPFYPSLAIAGGGLATDPTGTQAFLASSDRDTFYAFDFSGAQTLAMVSGDGQTGTVNQVLPQPLKVRVTDATSAGAQGVAVTFKVTAGTGAFTANNDTMLVALTDGYGYAEALWRLGPQAGAGVQQVQASGEGLLGSPATFNATAEEDPATLPLRLASVLPAEGSADVSATTSILVRFSRSIERSSITSSTLYLAKSSDSSLVPAIVGFADNDKSVSLTPIAPLGFGEQHYIAATAGITDTDAGPLANPDSISFTTSAPPPLFLSTINPVSSTPGGIVTISGTGFSATEPANSIMVGGTTTSPFDAALDHIVFHLPAGAAPGQGDARVAVGSDTSNALAFTVLVATSHPKDSVVASLNTEAPTKAMGFSLSGWVAYALSPEADLVIPIDIITMSTMNAIPVGDYPISIAMHPNGKHAYVANFGSGTVSIIITDPNDPKYNTVDTTITVGANPIDLAFTPSGDKLLVANAGSSTISVVDTDPLSAAYHTVVASAHTGASTKSLAVSPDGTRIYVGTDDGYVIIETTGYTVVGSGRTGSSTRSIIVTPDGGILILLTTEGTVLFVDARPGSSSENQVVGEAHKGTGVKSLALTPDGTLLYLVLEESDLIIVLSLEVEGSASAFDPEAGMPPPTIHVTAVDTIEAGEDPEVIVFDPTGSGQALIANAGDNTVTVLNAASAPQEPLVAEILVTPRTLNMKSRGRWVTGRIELPPDYLPQEIDISSVRLASVVPADSSNWTIEDKDMDGIEELVVKFDRALFQESMPQGEYVPTTITGNVRDRTFIGEDTIRTIRPTITFPSGHQVGAKQNIGITWTSPEGYSFDSVDVFWTPNDGRQWQPIACGVPNLGAQPWLVPYEPSESCRVMVTLYSGGEDVGMGMSQEMFQIISPVAVALQSFSASLQAGIPTLKWTASTDGRIDGFRVLASDNSRDGFHELTAEPVKPRYLDGNSVYRFQDAGAQPNRKIFYKLVAVVRDGAAPVFGPFEVIFHLKFALEQNVPNPFNPTTTISFSLPEDAFTRMIIYDISGRKVKRLVEEHRRGGYHKVRWNGRNDRGEPVAAGVYFCRVQAGKRSAVRKMVLLK